MDLHPIAIPPTDDERRAIDASLPEGEPTRDLLLPALHAAQSRFGWVSPGALGYIAERLHVAPAEAYGVATFYALFSMKERSPAVVHVCDDIACKLAGADALCAEVQDRLGTPGNSWMRSPCLGLCEQAPAALLTSAGEAPFERAWGHATADAIANALEKKHVDDPAPATLHRREGLKLLRRVGKVDPTSIDDYRAHGGYAALRRALEIGPSAVIREVSEAKLLGRGGAAFPTGRKWEAVAKNPVRPHYLVCNADESEPGTFKDRVLIENDPFALVEAMTIAGLTTGVERGFLYLRAEYPLAAERIENALKQARSRGLLGDDILGRGARFDIEVRRGAGAYICGEETALFNSIEGHRGEPRNKPPFPADVGLFGKPTVVNNVETLVNVLDIVTEGAAAYRAIGTPDSTGTRLFCLSGAIAKPGLYELPFGVRLDALIDFAGGVPAGRKIQAVLLGGAAGVLVTPDELSMKLTFEDTRRAGATLGSGVVMVIDDRAPLLSLLRRIAEFFRDESCGQCVPCRVGTVRLEELLGRVERRAPLGSIDKERVLLRELGMAMRDASICGLGQTASSVIETAARKLPLFREVAS